jgi:hypothetical protein
MFVLFWNGPVEAMPRQRVEIGIIIVLQKTQNRIKIPELLVSGRRFVDA